jgi:hypothetical protein
MGETTATNGPVATTIACFKVCTLCGETWKGREAFLADPCVRVIGYQVHFQDLEAGLFLFNHDACRTTLAIEAWHFTDLYQGPTLAGRKTGTQQCPAYCLRQDEIRPCPAECECAYVRDVLDTVARWEKAPLL